ncbi:hypothetical protein ACQPZ2_00780 [Nocardia pseudovaccinii]|uniref:hypothetical protein n=1 Tax=Nocardia pseudovaccinii TaxID=189540 RepID=UPI003D934549
MVNTDDEPDNGQFVWGWAESVALASMQITMMQADLAATQDEDQIAAKRAVRDEAVARLCTELISAESSTAQRQFVSVLAGLPLQLSTASTYGCATQVPAVFSHAMPRWLSSPMTNGISGSGSVVVDDRRGGYGEAHSMTWNL